MFGLSFQAINNKYKEAVWLRKRTKKTRKKIIKNTGVKVDEDRFKIHNSIHNNFAIRYFNMVASYLSGHKK